MEKRNGKLAFPTSKKNLGFELRELKSMPFSDIKVIHCEPDIPYPEDWLNKEKVIEMDDVDPVVRRSIYKSQPMMATEAFIVRDGKILAVKPNRGWGKGTWKLPAGVLGYRETPEQGVAREVMEEVGLTVKSTKLVCISKKTFPISDFWFTSFGFVCEVEGKIKLGEDEIEEARWMEPKQLAKITKNPFVSYGIKKLLQKGGELRVADLDQPTEEKTGKSISR